jgi:hypothetical protein
LTRYGPPAKHFVFLFALIAAPPDELVTLYSGWDNPMREWIETQSRGTQSPASIKPFSGA